MSVTIQPRQDVTYLFSSLGSGAANVAGSNFLGQYASIKNGSYAKLMKAYFNSSASDSVKSIVNNSRISNDKAQLTTEETKAYAKVQTAADALKESADALYETGSKSVFARKDITTTDENGVETTVKGYDTEAIYQAVDSFVTNYNSVINAAAEADNDTITNRAARMVNDSLSNMKSLRAMGITINDDSTLSLDKETFIGSNMTGVKSLFNGAGSYGYRVSAQASLINYAADHEANKGTSYTAMGTYSTNFSSGNLFSSWL